MSTNSALRAELQQFSTALQDELFPQLEAAVGPLNSKLKLFIACCATVPFHPLIPSGRWNGRPPKDRIAIARAFLAKSVFGLTHTRQLLQILRQDAALRRLCGWRSACTLPHESTFSRAFAEFAESGLAQAAHAAVIAATQAQRLVGHICRDATAILARERYPEAVPAPRRRVRTKKKRRRNQTQPPRTDRPYSGTAPATRLEKQAGMRNPTLMLADVPTQCDLGAKQGPGGNARYWRGYKLHLDVADGQIPITAVLTAASVHDSQVAIPMMHLTSQRVDYLYDLADSAYDAEAIRSVSRQLGHQPIIAFKTRPKPVTQLPCRIKPQPELTPAQQLRYRERTSIERVFARLKNEFGATFVRVRGPSKVMAHLMFGVLALTIDQILRLAQ